MTGEAYNTLAQNMGPLVRRLRKEAGKSQAQLADAMGLSQAQLCRKERQTNECWSVNDLFAVADFFQLTPCEFIRLLRNW